MTGSADEDLYYSYLSQLLDPVEGHESARRNSSLVMVSRGEVVQLMSVRALCSDPKHLPIGMVQVVDRWVFQS